MADPFAPPPRRERSTNVVVVRLAPTGREWVEGVASAHGVTISEVVKAALSFAAQQNGQFSKMIEARKK